MANWFDDTYEDETLSPQAALPSATVSPDERFQNEFVSTLERLQGLQQAAPDYQGAPGVARGLQQFSGGKIEPWEEFQARQDRWKAEQPKPEQPIFGLGDVASAAGGFISALPTTGTEAFYRMKEFGKRPDQYSPEAQAAFAESRALQERMAQEQAAREKAGTSTTIGQTIREATGSSGYTLGSMVPAIAGGVAGAKGGAALGGVLAGPPGAAIGGVLGGIAGGFAGSGAAAYTMSQNQFMEDAFREAEQRMQQKQKRSLNEQEKQALYQEMEPVARDNALWEAGPEAVGNAFMLVGGGIATGLLGKQGISKLAAGAMRKGMIRAGAGATGAGMEFATEVGTELGQALPRARMESYLEGKPMEDAVSRYAGKPLGGAGAAFEEIWRPTLGTLLMFGLGGSAVKGVSKANERFRQNPQEAEAIVEMANKPDVLAAMPQQSLENLQELSGFLRDQWFAGTERQQNMSDAIAKIGAELQQRTTEDATTQRIRQETLGDLWTRMAPQEQSKVLEFFGATSPGLTGWTTKEGTPTGQIDARGLNRLANTLGVNGQRFRARVEQELQKQQSAAPPVPPTTAPGIPTPTPTPTPAPAAKPTVVQADIEPDTVEVTEGQPTVTVRSGSKAVIELRRQQAAAAGAPAPAQEPQTAESIRRNIESPEEYGKQMLAEALASQRAAKEAAQAPPVPPVAPITPAPAPPTAPTVETPPVRPTAPAPIAEAPASIPTVQGELNAQETPARIGPAIQEPGKQIEPAGSQGPSGPSGVNRPEEISKNLSENSGQGPEGELTNAQQIPAAGAPNGSGGPRPEIRQEGGRPTESGEGLQPGGQGDQVAQPRNEEKAGEVAPAPTYEYGLRARPYGPGTNVPTDFTALDNEFKDANRRIRYGKVTYNRPLTDEEIAAAELVPLPSVPTTPPESANAQRQATSKAEALLTPGQPPASTGAAAAPVQIQKVKTPDEQMEVDVGLEVVELADLITSDDARFPKSLQPRGRGERQASATQVFDIAKGLNPDRLLSSPVTSDGAPIVGPDGLVESGNGRVMAIRTAYGQFQDRADAYRAKLQEQGFDTTGMTAPVLIRRRVSPLDDTQRIEFTQKSNMATVASMSPSETANLHAKRLLSNPGILDLYKGGDVSSLINSPFVTRLFNDVFDSNEAPRYQTAEGTISQAGIEAVESAFFAAAYPDTGILRALIEDKDTNIKTIGNALREVAPDIVQAKAYLAKDEQLKAFDLSGPITEAARLIRKARSTKVGVKDLIDNQPLFDPIDPTVDRLIRLFFADTDLRRGLSQQKLVMILRTYAENIRLVKPMDPLFADIPQITVGDLLSTMEKRREAELPAEQADLLGGGAARPSRPESGPRDQRPSANRPSAADGAPGPREGKEDGGKPAEPEVAPAPVEAESFSQKETRARDLVAKKFLDGEKFSGIAAARKFVYQVMGLEDKPASKKIAEEIIEQAVVQTARGIVSNAQTPEVAFKRLVSLYQEQQPNLATRTSESVTDQAYSTPIPLAYLASQLAGIGLNPDAVVVEPTAGNGALLVSAKPKQVKANEKNRKRADYLKRQGFDVSQSDATTWRSKEPVDILIANPPFGTVTVDGKKQSWTVPSRIAPDGKYTTTEIDHAIALQQLSNLKDDGVAVLLVGGVDAPTEAAKKNKYAGKAKRDFYWTLVNDYNVVDMFTVGGDLYARQGAKYPVDVIVIHGRRTTDNAAATQLYALPAATLPRIYESWDQLSEVIRNETNNPAWNPALREPQAVAPGKNQPGTPSRDRPDTGGRGSRPAGDVAGSPQPVGDMDRGGEQGRDSARDRGEVILPGTAPADDAVAAPAGGERGGRVRPDDRGGVAPQPDAVARPSEYGQGNKVFTADAAAAARERLRKKLGQVRSGIDPEMVQDGIILAGYHIEAGARQFAAYAKAMLDDLGDGARNYLRSWYEAARHYPGFDNSGMTPADETDRIWNKMQEDWKAPKKPAAPVASVEAALPAEPAPKKPETPKEKPSEGQVNYAPASKIGEIGTLMPVNMQVAAQNALQNLESRVGPVDAYVASELGYEQKDLGKYFAAEQIDSLGLAIDNLKRGRGYITADQTGVGKGRVNAGIMRWALRNGKTPIFVTEKPNLYRDMIRDLRDIGMGQGTSESAQTESLIERILITNSGSSIPMDDAAMEWYAEAEKAKAEGNPRPKQYGKFLKTPTAEKQKADLVKAISDVRLPGNKEIIFTTYDQMNPLDGQRTIRHDFMDAFAGRSVLLLDESHNAGGSGKADPNKFARSKYFRDLVEKVDGTFYSSATFAKRPDVMDLYRRTDMSMAVDNIDRLGEIISAGGIPLQQVSSAMLVEAGQLLRRERSFDGVQYETPTAPINQQVAENIATAMRKILSFSQAMREVVKGIKDDLQAQAASMGAQAGADLGSAESTSFTSVMHNLIAQFLLGLKSRAAVDQAISALQNGEKPIITVANTLESLLKEYTTDAGINIGDPTDMSFGTLLERYLEKSRMVRERKPFQKSAEPARRLEDHELTPRALRAFDDALKEIRAHDWSEIPSSPIDFIKSELIRAGYTVGEITGREYVVDYLGSTPTLQARGENERGIPGRIRAIQQFNDGRIDALILNRAGATGLSLHASPKTGTDLRRRHMIIAQPEANIDTHMQMLGRVHRTGQVIAPRYSQLVGNIPAEIRPAAVLAKKMASLNANTTSARSSAVTSKDALDFMNVYGDEAVAAVMFANQDLHRQLGEPLRLNDAGDGFEAADAARKVTGYLPMLPLRAQEQVYRDIESEYRSILETALAMGENKLEALTLETDAREVSATQVFDGIPGETSPFAGPARAVVYDIKRQGRSMTQDEIRQELATFAGVADPMAGGALRKKVDALREDLQKDLAKFLDAEAVHLSEAQMTSLETRAHAMADKVDTVLRTLSPGTSVSAVSGNGNVFYGVVIGVERAGKPKNPAVNSAWRIRIAVADSLRVLSLPLTRMEVGSPDLAQAGRVAIEPYDPVMVQNSFDNQEGLSREERTILEGNLLAAYSQFPHGQIVYFRRSEGDLRQGILMPRSFDLQKAMAAKAAVMKTSADAAAFMADRAKTKYLSGQNGDVVLRYLPRADRFEMTTPKSKAQGGRWFLNDRLIALSDDGFVSVGNNYRADFSPSRLPAVLDAVYAQLGERMRAIDLSQSQQDAAQPDASQRRFSRAPDTLTEVNLTQAQARAEAVEALGETNVRHLERNGFAVWLEPKPGARPLPGNNRVYLSSTGQEVVAPADAQAFVQNGVTHLIPSNMRTGALNALLHESAHLMKDERFSEGDRTILRLSHAVLNLSGLRNFIGNPGFQDLAEQVQRMAREGNSVALKALAQAQQVDPNRVAEESVAYLVEYGDMRLPIVRRILAAIRAALYRMGVKMELRPEDVRQLTISALKARAKRNKVEQRKLVHLAQLEKEYEEKYGDIALGELRVEVLRNIQEDTTLEQFRDLVTQMLERRYSVAPAIEVGETTLEEFEAVRALFQARQAETPFRQWFGKGTPGVTATVDGTPITLYHGTNNPLFTEWDSSRASEASGHPTSGLGFFMTADKRAAARYGNNLLELHAKIDKPYYLTDSDLTRIETRQDAERLRWNLMKQGYDGAVVEAPGAAPYVIAFKPNQIKFTTTEKPTASPDMRYSRQPEINDASLEAVRARYAGTPQWMKAPNGQSTKLNERQWLQVRTPEFKAWFGDWENDPENSSKVVDENGEPLIAFHGTTADFNAFETGKIGTGAGHKSSFAGFFFSADENIAALFPTEKWGGWPLRREVVPGQNIITGYLSINNPFVISANEFMMSFVRNLKDASAWRINLISEGYDGIVIHGDKDMSERMGGEEYEKDSWVAFNPTQIKSAIGNIGTFSPMDADIRYSLPPTPDDAQRFLSDIGAMNQEPQPNIIKRIWRNPSLWRKELVQFFTDAAGNTRPAWTRLLSRQQIVEMLQESPIAALSKLFEDTARLLDAEKQDGKHKPFDIAKRWREAAAKSRDKGRNFAKLLFFTTLEHVDPTQPLPDRDTFKDDRAYLDAKQSHARATQMLNDLRRTNPVMADLYKEVMDENKRSFKAYHEALQNRLSRGANGIFNAMMDRAKDVTPTGTPKTLTQRLANLANADSAAYDAFVDVVRQRLANLKMEAADANAIRDTLPDAEQKALLDDIVTDVQGKIKDSMDSLRFIYEQAKILEPYFPLSRWGDYQVYAEKAGEPKPIFSSFTRQQDQRAAIAQLQKEGWTVKVGYDIKDALTANPPADSFLGKMFVTVDEIVSTKKEAAALKDEFYQMYLRSLPELSSRKHFLHRKGIPGFSMDALRGFAQLANSRANSIARLNHSDTLSESLVEMERTLRRAGRDPNQAEAINRAGALLGELQSSYEWMMNPTNATWANRLTSFGFLWHLTNPSTALINLTQLPIATFPALAAQFKAPGRAFSALNKAIKDYGGWKFHGKVAKEDARKRLFDEYDGDLGRMMESPLISSQISRTEAVALAGMSDDAPEFAGGVQGAAAELYRSALYYGGWLYQKAEVANREITVIAAYRMAREEAAAKGLTREQAHNYASEIAYNLMTRTQGDFSLANRPWFMRGNAMRVMFLFRSFAHLMTWNILRDAYQWKKGQTAESRQIARDRLVWTGVSSLVFAGATGFPAYTIIAALANAFWGSDPDDPWDFDTAVRNELQAYGGETFMRTVMSGPVGQAPRVLNLMGLDVRGIDIAPRLSLDLARLWFRRQPDDIEGGAAMDWWMAQVAGPLYGTARGLAEGMRYLGQTSYDPQAWSRSIEGFTPAPIRNLAKSVRFKTEGVTSRQGDLLMDDFTYTDMLAQAIGFTPDELQDQYRTNTRAWELKTTIDKRRKNIYSLYIFATERGDAEMQKTALKRVERWNELNPEYPITYDNLRSSHQKFIRARALQEGGVFIPSHGLRARVFRDLTSDE